MPTKLIFIKEIASRLGMNDETVRVWLKKGKLKGALIGHKWCMDEDDLEAFIRSYLDPPQEDDT